MITKKDLERYGYKQIEVDEPLMGTGKYFYIAPSLDNVFSYGLVIAAPYKDTYRIYKTRTDTLINRGFSIGEFEAQVELEVNKNLNG